MTAEDQTGGILDRIARAKRVELERSRAAVPQSVLEKKISARRANARKPSRGFREALVASGGPTFPYAVIAELKKASPSLGVICEDYDPVAIARGYERAGARALSLLTDTEFFQGSLAHLEAVRQAVSLPLLRKDFTLDEYHIYEAAAAGADAVLLIVAILTPAEIAALLKRAKSLSLDALVEVHTADELKIALDAGAEIVGVNNRDLRNFEVSLNTSLNLIDSIPDACLAVSESGLRSAADLERLRAAGFDTFLIGERFMKEPEPGAALAQLLSGAIAPAERGAQAK